MEIKSSVAIASYNGSDYIQEQLQSIYEQTVQVEEVIICDDGSSDDTCEIVKRFIEQKGLSDSWKLVVNDNNLGYADNFHKAMMLCSGEYIFVCDQDDVWEPDKVEAMLGVMQKDNGVKLLCSDFTPLVSSSDAPSIKREVSRSMRNDGSVEQYHLNKRTMYLSRLGCLMCVRRSFLHEADKFWYSGWAHDEYLWRTALCFDGLYILHRRLVKRRLHSSNVSMRPKHKIDVRIKYLQDLLKSDENILRCAISNNMNEMAISRIKKNIRAAQLRLDLVKDHKISNMLRLVFYLDCYHSKRAYITEPLIMIKNSK
ncbi:glycosyltransferase [Butyrivibrio sp. MC2013]|uniref:glycosyltransferase n=1 Tax=Butyrivibrio sp. MC2013 TaxID=1280686 RepID=UPI00040C3149|nr:glycosyltransferase [Butyrivibrio sp. MC2013]